MKHTWPIRLAIAAIAIATVGLIATWGVPFASRWPFVLVEHFRVQCAAGGIVVAACAAVLSMTGWFDAAAIATLLQLFWIAPDLNRARQPIPPDGVPVRVLMLNVHTESSSFAEVRKLIEDTHPDIVGLVEVDERWLTGVAPAVVGFEGRLEKPRSDNFGVALYTRAPLDGAPLDGAPLDGAPLDGAPLDGAPLDGAPLDRSPLDGAPLDGAPLDGAIESLGGTLPVAVGTTTIRGAQLSIVLVHPLPPVSAANLASQRAELAAVADRVHALSPVIVTGDFNATPWSTPYREFLARSELCDSRAGFGIEATFPADSLILRIPIDHLLASCSIGIADRRVGPDVGSDHLPIIVELVVPKR